MFPPLEPLQQFITIDIFVIVTFCSQNAMEKYLDAKMYDTEDTNFCTFDLFSIKFCLQVLSMLLQDIDQGYYFIFLICDKTK